MAQQPSCKLPRLLRETIVSHRTSLRPQCYETHLFTSVVRQTVSVMFMAPVSCVQLHGRIAQLHISSCRDSGDVLVGDCA